MRVCVPLSVVALATTVPVVAQVAWFKADARFEHAVAPNPNGPGVALFGGSNGSGLLGDTWVRDANGGWRQAGGAAGPAARRGHSMSRMVGADDAVRVLMVGGERVVRAQPVRSPETWRWTGDTWSLGPPLQIARDGHAMVWDSARSVVVLFGGSGDAGLLNDVVEYDGVQDRWVARRPAGPAPLPRSAHAMAFDENRAKVVMFGGSGNRNDTFEYDGAMNGGNGAWTAIPVASPPPGRRDHALAFDRANGDVVMFGGRNGSQAFAETWVYDPNVPGWVQRSPITSPPARYGHRMEYDSSSGTQAVVMVGGKSFAGDLLYDTWKWTGSNWEPADAQPSPRSDPVFEFDAARGRSVLFGGYSGDPFAPLGDTWTWDGARWKRENPALSPLSRFNPGACFDPIRQRVVMFGGRTGNNMLGDTWVWDGQVWSNVTPAASPTPRHEPSMAFDAARGKVVLFGGLQDLGVAFANDTWTWDGSAWTLESPAGPVPSPRYYADLAFDHVSRRLILFGGWAFPGVALNDTWAWDGATWTQLSPLTVPPARVASYMTADSIRGRLVLTGGLFPNGPDSGEVWEWDGADWTQRANIQPPAARKYHSVAFDSARGRVVMFGGISQTTLLNDTWEYGTLTPASAASFGAGCAGSNARIPALTCPPPYLPWLGSTCRLAVADLAPNSIAVMYLGASNTLWQGTIPLPLSLAPLMPGCSVRVSLDLAVGSVVSPSGYVPLPIPLAPQLLGQGFFAEAVVVDPPANSVGVVLSNAIEAVFGTK